MSSRPEHPIERAEVLIADEPILALDWSLRAFADTRGHRSDPDTRHYLDVMASATLRASGIPIDPDEPPLNRMLGEPICDELGTAALLRLLVLDDDVFEDQALRSSAFALFDRRVGPRLYDRLKLTVNRSYAAPRGRP